MTHSTQPLSDALIDSNAFSLAVDRLAAAQQSEINVFSAQFLGERDILRELGAAEKDFHVCDLDSCENRLLCLQAHIERLCPGNIAGLACIFLCLGLVKQRQHLFYHSFGYLLHALSVLEQDAGSVNPLAVLILNAISGLELDRHELERAETAKLLARLVTQKMRVPIPDSLSVWEYLRSQTGGMPLSDAAEALQPLEECYCNFRSAVRSHGMASIEAAAASTKLGATLYAQGRLSEARRYLERGVSVCRHSNNVGIRDIADIYDLLVTICEELDDPPASNRFRTQSRMLRMCASILPGLQAH